MIRSQIHKIVDDLFDLHAALLPCPRSPEAREHIRSAGREVLLALRSMLDSALHRVETTDAKNQFVRVPVESQSADVAKTSGST
jgi:hypothetical protein